MQSLAQTPPEDANFLLERVYSLGNQLYNVEIACIIRLRFSGEYAPVLWRTAGIGLKFSREPPVSARPAVSPRRISRPRQSVIRRPFLSRDRLQAARRHTCPARFPDESHPETSQKDSTNPSHKRAIGTPRKHAGKLVVLANRLIVELAMEALERREWPRTEAEISPKSLRNCRMIQRNRSRIDSAREAPPTILRASTSPIRLFPPGKATGSGAADRWREICESLARRQVVVDRPKNDFSVGNSSRARPRARTVLRLCAGSFCLAANLTRKTRTAEMPGRSMSRIF